MGHVNNAVYFTYFEIARERYWEEVFDARIAQDCNFILASEMCDFLAQTSYGETLEVGVRIPSAGRTSFEFEYEVRAVGDGRLAARGRSTQVLFDYAGNCKMPVTEEWLARVEAAEGRRPSSDSSPRSEGNLRGPEEDP